MWAKETKRQNGVHLCGMYMMIIVSWEKIKHKWYEKTPAVYLSYISQKASTNAAFKSFYNGYIKKEAWCKYVCYRKADSQISLFNSPLFTINTAQHLALHITLFRHYSCLMLLHFIWKRWIFLIVCLLMVNETLVVAFSSGTNLQWCVYEWSSVTNVFIHCYHAQELYLPDTDTHGSLIITFLQIIRIHLSWLCTTKNPHSGKPK